ncbi:MAG: hypothetical protein PHQ86_06540 [Dehalococcoidales bacterium]|jgi:archaellum component FlaC|nr:hypothetical protein [Dehalococcoidales bacterium]
MERRDDDLGEERPSRPRQRRRYDIDDEDEVKKPANNRQSLYLLGVAVVLSFLVVFVWANSALVARKAYEIDTTGIVADMGKQQSAITALQNSVGKVDAINSQVSQISDKVNALSQQMTTVQSSLADYAKKDSLTQINNNITSLQNSLNTIQSQVSNIKQVDTSVLSASIDTLKTQVSALQAQVLALQQGGGTVTPGDAIQVSVKTLGNNALSPIDTKNADGTAGSDGIYDGLQGSMRITLTNNTLVDVDDAIVDLEFNIAPAVPTAFAPSVSGGGVPWHREYSDPQFMEFYNGAWGLSVPAGQTVTLTLSLTIQGTNSSAWNISGGYYYQLQASAS